MRHMKPWDSLKPAQQLERWDNALRVMLAMTPHERKRHFDMTQWGEKNACGTIGCVMGLCGLDPWFRRRGLRLFFDKNVQYNENGEPYHAGGFFPPDAGWAERGTYDSEARDFFGPWGRHIFLNCDERKWGQVVKEMRAAIAAMQRGEQFPS